ncbi:hydroxypyruvate isomerase [Serratia microhaemolytica]|uniref:hydroxypyruvate isomerase n=1 Tax=Serratia microhaemolytica TaxID=2675110 RepID=UPI000FDE924D|nr:hydroxypyruvate isomerase [Serratia microhaemolytica]
MAKFAANLSMLFNEYPFMARFAAAKKAGFDGVEYLFPYEFSAQEIAEQLDKQQLTQVLFNLPAGNWLAGERGIACLPDRVDEFRRGVESAIVYANALGCRQVNCLAGKKPHNVSVEQAHRTLVDNLKFAAQRLAEQGINLLLEAINTRDIADFFVNRSPQAAAIIAEVGASNLGYQYDIYHMQIMEGDLTTTFERYLPIIGHVQLADNPGRHEPGSGEINYPFLLKRIDALGYSGWIGCEYIPANGTEAGLGWLKQMP